MSDAEDRLMICYEEAVERIAELEAALKEISEDKAEDAWAADLAQQALQEIKK